VKEEEPMSAAVANRVRAVVDLSAYRYAREAAAAAGYRRHQIAESVYAADVQTAVAGVLSARRAEIICDRTHDRITDAFASGTPASDVARELVDEFWDHQDDGL
jgi:hypothetical protein